MALRLMRFDRFKARPGEPWLDVGLEAAERQLAHLVVGLAREVDPLAAYRLERRCVGKLAEDIKACARHRSQAQVAISKEIAEEYTFGGRHRHERTVHVEDGGNQRIVRSVIHGECLV